MYDQWRDDDRHNPLFARLKKLGPSDTRLIYPSPQCVSFYTDKAVRNVQLLLGPVGGQSL